METYLLRLIIEAYKTRNVNENTRMICAQLRDDLMTLLIAGHETTAAVLTWTLYCLALHPEHVARLQAEARILIPLGDLRSPLMCALVSLPGLAPVVSGSL